MLKYNPILIKLPLQFQIIETFLDNIASKSEMDIVISTGFSDKEYENFVLIASKVDNLFYYNVFHHILRLLNLVKYRL